MNLYTIRDVLACEYGPSFEAKNSDVAIRVVKQLVLKTPSISLNEYELYELGSFDHETGSLVALSSPKFLSGSFNVPLENLSKEV